MGDHIVAPSRASMGSEPGIALRFLHHLKFEEDTRFLHGIQSAGYLGLYGIANRVDRDR